MNKSINKVQSAWELPSWLSQILQDDQLEESLNITCTVPVLAQAKRDFMWKYAEAVLGPEQAKRGAVGYACAIYERFIWCESQEYNHSDDLTDDFLKRARIEEDFSTLTAVCLQLASKVSSASSEISTLSTHFALRTHKLYVTIEEIKRTESWIHQTIGFRAPKLTNVQQTQMFAKALDFTKHMFVISGLMMDLVDRKLGQVTAYVKKELVNAPSSSSAGASGSDPLSYVHQCKRLRTLHLVAGVVMATNSMVRGSTGDPSVTLARWTNSNIALVRDLGRTILLYIRDRKLLEELVPKSLMPPNKKTVPIYPPDEISDTHDT